MCSADIFLGLLAVLFPPLPVWVKCGLCSADSLINILLCCLGYIPGLLHSWYIIAKFPEAASDYDRLPQEEGGRVTYVFVQADDRQQPRRQQPKPQGNMSYGATNNGTSSNGQNKASSSSAPAPAPQQNNNAGEGSSGGNDHPPPSYAQVVAGDNKVQSHD